MPKEGYESITIPEELSHKIEDFVENSQGLVQNKTKAIALAWQIYEKIYLEEKNPKPVRIGDKLVGHDQPIYVVAEIGINHNGSLETCKKMIDMAVEAGCDAVKFQKRTPEICVPENHKNALRDTPWGTMTYLEYRKRMEFGKEEFKEIDEYCKNKGIMWYASAWDIPSIDFLEQFDMPCYKIPSACLTDKKLLLKFKSAGKPLVLSTGMSTMEQIKKAVKILGEDNLIILHCTSTYPTPETEHNLNVIKTFRKYFNCPIGYSGHEPGVWPSIIAATIGACMLERHITLDRTMYGTDQAASLEKKGISIICEVSKAIPTYLGDGNKKVYDSEKPIVDRLRRIDSL